MASGIAATAIGQGSLASGLVSTALGRNSEATGENSTALGDNSIASELGTTALGRGSQAEFTNSTALGSGVVTTRINQMAFGTTTNTYTLPGMTSLESHNAQTGHGQFVTSDVSGNLAPTTISTRSVGIGTFTPDLSSRVDIRSSTLNNGVLAVRSDSGPHYLRVQTGAGTFRSGVQGNGDVQIGSLTAGKKIYLLAGGTSKMAINSTGQISFGHTLPAITDKALVHQSGANLTLGGTWTNASSRALKQDIEPITSEEALNAMRALQPVGYRYKSELNERYVGFIAEDVPELVATNDRKGLAPMDIVAVLTRVVQDQDRELAEERQRNEKERQRNDKQERLIETLMRRLSDLEQRGDGSAPTK
ncbi:MAG: tail fiber domain-containing protein [Planctomycetota bacterium]